MTKHTQNAIEAIFETAPVGCTIRDAERIYLAADEHHVPGVATEYLIEPNPTRLRLGETK